MAQDLPVCQATFQKSFGATDKTLLILLDYEAASTEPQDPDADHTPCVQATNTCEIDNLRYDV